MPAPLLDKEELVARVSAVFREHGYDGTSLARLQEATGLGRGSLYHHFPGGKEEMAVLVLKDIAAWFEAEVLAPLAEDGPIGPRLNRTMSALDAFYRGGAKACVIDLFTIGDARRLFGHEADGLIAALQSGIEDALIRTGTPTGRATRLVRTSWCGWKAHWSSPGPGTTTLSSPGP